MSVDYYLACEKCRESIHIAQDGFSGFTFYSGEHECMKALEHFLSVHTICGGDGARLIDEHQDEDGNYKNVEWKKTR